jgi:hypothetical protein
VRRRPRSSVLKMPICTRWWFALPRDQWCDRLAGRHPGLERGRKTWRPLAGMRCVRDDRLVPAGMAVRAHKVEHAQNPRGGRRSAAA